MSKKINKKDTSTELKIISKPSTWHEALQRESWLYFPDKQDWRERLINTMYEWAQLDDSLEITQFCIEWKIPRRTLYGWRDAHPDIKQAIDDIKIILGNRRRLGVIHKKFDKDMVLKDMHCYDPEWLEINKYHAELKRQEEVQKGIVVVEIPSTPSSDRVKARLISETNDDNTP